METLNVQDVNVDEDPFATPQDGVSIGTPVPQAILPETVIDTRARKMQAGVGRTLQRTTEEIRTEIKEGREQLLREQAAADYNSKQTQDRYQRLVALAAKKGGPLNENETREVLDPFNPKNAISQPDSIVEKEYATKYIGSLTDATKAFSSPIQQAQREQPLTTEENFVKGSELQAKQEFGIKLEEDMRARFKDQTIVGNLADTVKQMFQPYVEAKMRGLSPAVSSLAGVGLGDQLQATADYVFNLPYEQSVKEARRIGEALAADNPSLAIRWAEYYRGLARSERVLDSAFTYLMPFDYAALGKLGVNISRAVSVNRRANLALKQLVEEGEKIAGDPVKTAEVTGDLTKAAEGVVGDNVTAAMAGEPKIIKIATDDTLLTFFNQDKAKIAESPGNLRQEQVRRIQDGFDAAGRGLFQRLVDTVRINRTPMPVAVQNAVAVIKNAVKEYYPAIRNAIQDVSDPLYEPVSNTYWHRITIGNFDGTLFSNEKTAQNFAEYHGLKARIVQDQGPITSKETQEIFNKRSKLQRDLANVDENIATYRKQAEDVNLPEDKRRAANEQVQLFQEFKRTGGKELEDLNLRLRGSKTADRVNALKTEIEQLRLENRDNRKRLKETKDLPEENRNIINQMTAANVERIRANIEEAKAIISGKADVIGGNPATVVQHGTGFKLVIERPLVETDHVVRDLMIRDVDGKLYPEATSVGSSQGLKSIMNAALYRFRGADDTLALNESIQRKIGTYTQSVFKEWAKQEAKYIQQIASGVIRYDPVTGQEIPYWRAKPTAILNKLTGKTKQDYAEFTRTLDYSRDAKDPLTGKPGYFFQKPSELQNHYLTYFRRQPSFAEQEAYFAFVRLVEGDRVLREISEFRNRARLGVEQFQLSVRNGKETIKSDFFDGRTLKNFPGGDDVMLIMSRRGGDEKIVNLGGASISPQKLAEYKEMVKQGRMKVIEVYAPEHKPLSSFSKIAGNEHVRYVLTETAESKPLEFNHVNRRGGGHFEYDYDHYIKQAKYYHQYDNLQGVKNKFKSVYTGDSTFMPVLNRVMGSDIVKHITEIQQLLKKGDVDAARAYTEAKLPIEFDELHNMFKPGRDAQGNVTEPALSLNEPFHVVPNGKSVMDVDHKGMLARYGDTFKDASRSGSLNKQFQVAYNTERESFGLSHLEDIGTQGNPLYKYSPTAKMVDPITTMNKSLNRIVNTVFMDDYKIMAVEHWLREAEQHLEPVRASLARSSPYWVFTSSIDKSAFLGATDRDVVNNLLNNRYKIQQFLGVPNVTDTALHVAKQWLVDTSYKSFGPEATRGVGAKALLLVPNWMLNSADPISFLRSMTFHEKLGLFNPAQLLVQMQTFATILSIAPAHGTAGTYATLLHSWSRLNRSDAMIRKMDEYASKLALPGQARWKPGQFEEAMRTLDRTGFERVAGEVASLDTALKSDYIMNDWKSFLNAGTFFFREGEKSVRLGAWYTAFKEYRDTIKPIGALTRDDVGKILQRADLLTVNMSRASNSMLNSSVLSLTTQFLNYQVRLAELFLGQRLGGTLAERNMARARMMTFYSLLYGAPSAIGLTGLPVQDSIRKEAIQRGYVVGDNWLSTAVDQGLPAVAMAVITGGGDFRKGNNYNIGGRYGSPGLTQFNEALKSDNPWWRLIAGASGTALFNTLTSTNNFFHAMGSQFFRPNGEKPFPLKLDDFIDMFKEISTVNQAWKLHMAINTGKWMSKNEGYIGDVSKASAAFMAITGLSPAQQEDAFLKGDVRKEQDNIQKYVMKEAIKELRRGYDDQKANNWKSAREHFARADTMMEISGMPSERRADVLSMSAKGYETTIDSQDYQFANKNVPQSRGTFMGVPTPFTTQTDIPKTRTEQFRRTLQLNDYKNRQ